LESARRRLNRDEVARDGEFVRVPLIVMDAAVSSKIEGGKRELSACYPNGPTSSMKMEKQMVDDPKRDLVPSQEYEVASS
jgi:hypothetical protein